MAAFARTTAACHCTHTARAKASSELSRLQLAQVARSRRRGYVCLMDETRQVLQHELAALAYRTQKALRGAPDEFATFRAHSGVRTPIELVRHMANVIGYACTFFTGGEYRPAPLPSLGEEIDHFHGNLIRLRDHVDRDPFDAISPHQLLQGPMADAMTHIGQLAMLRRMFGSPVPPENFVFADVDAHNLTPDQAAPAAPDEKWTVPEDGLLG